MDLDTLANNVKQEYRDRLLTKQDVKKICNMAMDNRIIERGDICVDDIPECTSKELIDILQKCRIAFLTRSINDSEETENFISKKYYSPRENNNLVRNDNLIKNDNLVKNDLEHNNDIIKKDTTPYKYESLLTRHAPENPFTNENFQSFCEDLKIKTSTIKKHKNMLRTKVVKDVIDKFIEYKIKEEGRQNISIYVYGIPFVLCIVLYMMYTSEPV